MMVNDTTKIFNSTSGRSVFAFLDGYNFKTPYFKGTIIIGTYLLVAQVIFKENPIIYLIFGIVGFYAAIFMAIKFFSRKVIKITFDLNTAIFTYRYKIGIYQHTSKLNSTLIQLIELKDHKSYFEGIQINFKDTLERKSFKLMQANWSYNDLENIYKEYKARKKEEIPENEFPVFTQHQIMNKTGV